MDSRDALKVAEDFLLESWVDGEPELAIDYAQVKEVDGLLIAPYNSTEYLQSRNVRDMLLDCWPILVDLESGNVRFGLISERHLWR